DLSGAIEVFRRIRIGAIEELVRPGRDAKRGRGSHVGVLRLEGSVVVENLDSFISTVGGVDIALRIDCNRKDGAEQTRAGSFRAPGFNVHALAVEFGDSSIAD